MYEVGKVKEAVTQHMLLLIRTDWLKKLNLSMPTTTEELMAVAKAFAEQDPDGNGKKDTYGMNMSTIRNKQSMRFSAKILRKTCWPGELRMEK